MRNLKKNLSIHRFKDIFHLGIATGGFVGFLPFCPGTFGALEGAIIFWFFKNFSFLTQISFTIGISFLGAAASHYAKKFFSKEDPDEVVIDEIAGMWLGLIGKTKAWEFILGFILFRIIDISKPFPLRRLEKLPSGIGIMADDPAGGIMTNLILTGFTCFLIKS